MFSLVRVDDREYYKTVEKTRDREGAREVHIGKSITLTSSMKEPGGKITFCPFDDLFSLTYDLEFFIAVLEEGHLWLANEKFTISKAEISSFDGIQKLKARLSMYQSAEKALTKLHASGHIPICALPPEESANLQCLITAFVNNEPCTGLKEDLPECNMIQVSCCNFLIVFQKSGDTPGTYILLDYFDSEYGKNWAVNDIRYPTSPYFPLKKEEYLTVTNINWQDILPSYQKITIDDNPYIYENANFTLLELLAAYDESNKKYILDTALPFAMWLKSVTSGTSIQNLAILNYIQCKRRLTTLDDGDIGLLNGLIEDSSIPEDVKTGAYLLLENQSGAYAHFAKLSTKQQEVFNSFPIAKFWNPK